MFRFIGDLLHRMGIFGGKIGFHLCFFPHINVSPYVYLFHRTTCRLWREAKKQDGRRGKNADGQIENKGASTPVAMSERSATYSPVSNCRGGVNYQIFNFFPPTSIH